jgi:hypothetical protein
MKHDFSTKIDFYEQCGRSKPGYTVHIGVFPGMDAIKIECIEPISQFQNVWFPFNLF